MHVCVLYQHYLRPGDAGHSRINDHANAWARAGHRVTVITGQVPYMTGRKEARYRGRIASRERDGPVEVWRTFLPDRANESFLRRGLGYLAFAASSVLAYAAIPRPDVLFVSSPPLPIGLGALVARGLSRVPMVFEVRDLWPQAAVSAGLLSNRAAIRALYALERRCYRAAARVVVLTEAFRDDLLLRGAAPAAKIDCVPAGVDLTEWSPGRRSESLRHSLGWDGRFVALYSGAHGVANGVGVLLDAAERLRDRPDVLIATAGAGMELDALRRSARERGLSNLVLLGPQPRDRMPAITASADACVAVLKRSDAFRTVYPNKVFDAMASARPVVVAIDGIARALVEGAGAGLHAPPEDADALARGIRSLADDPEGAAAMGSRGRALVEARFDRRRAAQDLLAILSQAARGR
jgi:glycosyltransferase involved in cell wall biosynthesis